MSVKCIANKFDVGKVHRVLVEGFSKRSDEYLQGRNTANKVVVFPKETFSKGQYVNVLVEDCSGGTLFGTAVK
jgi:tRNA-2-methylthio-N6-dimethylallyladenosine synthase